MNLQVKERSKGGGILTDNQICELMKSSPQEGRRTFFDKYCSYVYAIAASKLKSCGSREDIEECVSDVFAELFRLSINPDGELKALVGVVVRRTAIDYFRKLSIRAGRTVSTDDESTKDIRAEDDVEANTERSELKRILLECISQLGEPDSVIIIQQFIYGRTVHEISSVLQMTEAAVHKRSLRARGKLKVLLAENGVEEV